MNRHNVNRRIAATVPAVPTATVPSVPTLARRASATAAAAALASRAADHTAIATALHAARMATPCNGWPRGCQCGACQRYTIAIAAETNHRRAANALRAAAAKVGA